AGARPTRPAGRGTPACHRYSTSARERIGGFTLAYVPAGASTSSSRWPTVTSRRKSTFGNAAAIVSALSSALRDERCNRLTLTQPVSWARYEATATARPSACGGRAALYAARPGREATFWTIPR